MGHLTKKTNKNKKGYNRKEKQTKKNKTKDKEGLGPSEVALRATSSDP